MYSNALKQYRLFRNVESVKTIDQAELEGVIAGYSSMQETERNAIVKSRIGQGLFRKELIRKYNGCCIITGINEKKLLIASHIKPWAVCDEHEKVDPNNGFMLSPLFDKLFDKGWPPFGNSFYLADNGWNDSKSSRIS